MLRFLHDLTGIHIYGPAHYMGKRVWKQTCLYCLAVRWDYK